MDKLKNNLKELRKQKKLTQQAVSEILKIDRTTYSKYETGDSEPSIETIIKLADIFEASIDEIIGYKAKNVSMITNKEFQMIYKYRNTTQERKNIIDELLKLENDLSNDALKIIISPVVPTNKK